METSEPPAPASLAPQLYFQLVHTMMDLLPPPLDDSPAALRARNHAAIAKAASLLPVNANETDLAAQCVIARAQAEDVMRLIRENAHDIKLVMRLNAQYALMVRTSQSAQACLLRVQAVRHKRDAIEGATTQDAWTQHVAERCMLIVADPDFERLRAASPGAAPGNAPGAAPGNAPKAAPGNPPDAAPGNAPGAAPTNAPKAAPGNAPDAALGKAPDAAPDAAPAEGPVAAPTPHRQQEIVENVSDNDTNSHSVAFETWMSEQLASQGPDETGLSKRVLEAMAESLLADRALWANGRQSPETPG